MIWDDYAPEYDAITRELLAIPGPGPAPRLPGAARATPAQLREHAAALEAWDREHAAFQSALDAVAARRTPLIDAATARLQPTYLPHHPELHGVVYARAYEDGHSGGMPEIELEYAAAATFALAVLQAVASAATP